MFTVIVAAFKVSHPLSARQSRAQEWEDQGGCLLMVIDRARGVYESGRHGSRQ